VTVKDPRRLPNKRYFAGRAMPPRKGVPKPNGRSPLAFSTSKDSGRFLESRRWKRPGEPAQPRTPDALEVGALDLPRCKRHGLPHGEDTGFDKNPIVTRGAIVENKRLGAVLAAIQASQTRRDQVRLASRKLSLREKDRLRAARARAGTPDAKARPRNPNR